MPRIVWLAFWALVMVSATSSFHSSSSSSTNNNNNPYQFNKKVEKIVIVGGTHGNEYTGVWCVQAWETTNPSARYPSLSIQTLIGNPEAHRLNRRFVDNDLNREFTSHRLVSQCVVKDNNVINNNNKDATTTTTRATTTTTAANLLVDTVESRRAHELNQLLGPKSKPTQDLIIDLHTTTANMGTTLIIPAGDTFLAKVVSYVQSQLPHVRILVHNVPNRDDRPNLGSMARHGLTIEVGPVPQGVLRHDAVEATQQALMSVLDYCELHHHHQKQQKTKPLLEGKRYIPCFRSAPAQRPGDLSGKITWPTCPTNPNFPLYMIHSSLQDQDYSLLRTGDPLFVKLDGTIIPYDGSHGSPVHILFVNEGGYYYSSSGTGIGVAVAATLDCHTGNFVSKELL